MNRHNAVFACLAAATGLVDAHAALAQDEAGARQPRTDPPAARPSPPAAAAASQTPAAAAAASRDAAGARAQAARAESAEIGEIVVTAQFREQRLQDTPIAITAVNAAMLAARSQTNITQITDQAPSVQIRPQGAAFGPSISASIRGVGQNDFNPAFEPGVGIYVDDVYYPQLTGAVFDLLDLDRVEVLRGPQGTLAGRNSEGGAIKMYSSKPSGATGGYLEATYGSDKRIGLRGSAQFTLAPDLFARLSGVFKRQDGYVDRLDFGCVYPAGGSASFVNAAGQTLPVNPAGGVPRLAPAGDCRLDKLGGIGYEALRGILRYAPSDALDISLTGDFTHDQHTIPGEVLIATAPLSSPNFNAGALRNVPFDNRFLCGKFCNFATTGMPAINYIGLLTPGGPAGPGEPILAISGDDQSLYESWGVSNNIHYVFSDMLSLDNILAYQHFKAHFDSDGDLSPVNTGYGINQLRHWNWSEELRLNVKLGDRITATLGGYYFKQSTTYNSYQDLRYVAGGILEPLQFVQPDIVDADSKAVFGNASLAIVRGLNLNAGLRYTKEAKQYHYFRLNPDGTINRYLDPIGALNGAGTPGALTGAVGRYEGARTDYRVSLDYRFSPELLVYGSIATGFKGGGTNPRPFFIDQVIAFRPETLTNYEIGFKSDLFDRRVRLNVSAFYDPYKNIQLPVLTCPQAPCAARLNAGDGKFKGVEAELYAKPIPALQIDASASYLSFKFSSVNAIAAYPSNPGGVVRDDPPTGTPRWKWSAGVQYGAALGRLGSIIPRVDVSHEGKVYSGPFNDARGVRQRTFLPAYTVANARLTWRNPANDLEASFEITNFTDKYYFLTNFDLRSAGEGFDSGQPARPRQWALTIKKKF